MQAERLTAGLQAHGDHRTSGGRGRCALLAAAFSLVSALGFAPAASAADQTYTGDLIKMTVQDDGTPNIEVKPSTAAGPGDPYVYQYFGQYAWGNVLWVDGGAGREASRRSPIR